jgi:hypothetical protein
MKTMIYIDGKLMDEASVIHYTIANYPNHVTEEIDINDATNMLDTFGHIVEEYAPLPCVVGIDNGVSGGVAILSQHNGSIIATSAMFCKERNGKNEVDVYTLYQWLRDKLNGRLTQATYYIEEPAGSKSLGAALSMASSFHSIRGMLETKGLNWHGVPARKWQKALMGKTKIPASKVTEQELAKKLWPDEQWVTLRPTGKKLHDGVIDAVLIANWGREQSL